MISNEEAKQYIHAGVLLTTIGSILTVLTYLYINNKLYIPIALLTFQIGILPMICMFPDYLRAKKQVKESGRGWLDKCPDGSTHNFKMTHGVRHGYMSECQKCNRTMATQGDGFGDTKYIYFEAENSLPFGQLSKVIYK